MRLIRVLILSVLGILAMTVLPATAQEQVSAEIDALIAYLNNPTTVARPPILADMSALVTDPRYAPRVYAMLENVKPYISEKAYLRLLGKLTQTASLTPKSPALAQIAATNVADIEARQAAYLASKEAEFATWSAKQATKTAARTAARTAAAEAAAAEAAATAGATAGTATNTLLKTAAGSIGVAGLVGEILLPGVRQSSADRNNRTSHFSEVTNSYV